MSVSGSRLIADGLSGLLPAHQNLHAAGEIHESFHEEMRMKECYQDTPGH